MTHAYAVEDLLAGRRANRILFGQRETYSGTGTRMELEWYTLTCGHQFCSAPGGWQVGTVARCHLATCWGHAGSEPLGVLRP